MIKSKQFVFDFIQILQVYNRKKEWFRKEEFVWGVEKRNKLNVVT